MNSQKASNLTMLDQSPGRRLHVVISEILERSQMQDGFIKKADDLLGSENKFSNYMFGSTVNYIVRRLIKTAKMIQAKPLQLGRYNDPAPIRTELSSWLRNYTKFESRDVQRMIPLILECLEHAKKEINETTYRKIRKIVKSRRLGCRICGRTFTNFSDPGKDDFVSMDHDFPHSLGGSSMESNLSATCKKCNSEDLKDAIDKYDFHFERMVHSSHEPWGSADSKVAVLMYNDCACGNCGKQAAIAGRLEIRKIEKSDSWHLLNLTTYCEKCLKKMEGQI